MFKLYFKIYEESPVIKKQYLKTRDVCKVTFRIPESTAIKAREAAVVGDFNHWDAGAHPMKKLKTDGSFKTVVELPRNGEYAFRYLVDGKEWINEPEADRSAPTPYPDARNSLIQT
jgi:1,4-alpha-glucan branching enzyme